MSSIAIIPARGGSKRIPRKNIRPFGGRPILHYPITAALGSGLFSRVVVSTEDAEIAEVARAAGAQTPFIRPGDIADDYSDTQDVMAHAVRWLLENTDEQIEAVCCIYATAPFLTAANLQEGLARLRTCGGQYAFSATRFEFPVQRAIQLDEQGRVSPLFPQWIESRSQDLIPAFHDAGQFYWGTVEAFLNKLPVFAPHSSAVLLPSHQVQDIDTEEDWLRAERLFQLRNAR